MRVPFRCVSLLVAAALAGCGDVPAVGAEVTPGTSRVVQSVRAGGPNPAPLPLEIRNNGLCPEMDFTLTAETLDGAAWLTVTPAMGTIPARGNANVLVNLDVTGPNLAPGTYTGSLRISATCRSTMTPAQGSPSAVGVNLTVEGVEARLGVQESLDLDLARLENRWTTLSVAQAPNLRDDRRWSAHWSGRRLLVWNEATNVGGSYDPVADQWAPMAAQPTNIRPQSAENARVLWANGRLYAFGGAGGTSNLVRIYDPTMNAWTSSAGATGTAPTDREGAAVEWVQNRLLVWGGRVGGQQVSGGGATWNPSNNTWTALPTTGAPAGREFPCAGSSGNRVVVWGGLGAQGDPVDGGALWDQERGAWRAIVASSTSASFFRMSHCRLTWTGTKFVTWASRNGNRWDRVVRSFDPLTDTWTTRGGQASLAQQPPMPIEAWTGNRFITYAAGGAGQVMNLRTDVDEPLTTSLAPTGPGVGVGAWTGSGLLALVTDFSGLPALRRFD